MIYKHSRIGWILCYIDINGFDRYILTLVHSTYLCLDPHFYILSKYNICVRPAVSILLGIWNWLTVWSCPMTFMSLFRNNISPSCFLALLLTVSVILTFFSDLLPHMFYYHILLMMITILNHPHRTSQSCHSPATIRKYTWL